MKESIRIIVFAIIIAVVCSGVLFGVTQFTQPYREINEEAERVNNFLIALGAPLDENAGSEEIINFFKKNVRIRKINGFEFYEYYPGSTTSGEPSAIAIPFSGSGLWTPIKGVIALEPDLIIIKGISFYQQEETPGLGGEIASDWFQKQFKGKKILSADGKLGFKITKHGKASGPNEVDGITGATMTSERVQAIIDELAKKIWEVRDKYVRH